jgi:RNA polymerase sigma-70 factor (ECF subfamily)
VAEHEEDITELLQRFEGGDEAARNALVEAVYDELRLIAGRHMGKERDGHTLQTTALVNEAYLKLVNIKHAHWQDRAHFFAVAARIMRQILVDHARQRLAGKRGGGVVVMPLNEALVFSPETPEKMIEVDEALTRLSLEDELVGRVVELRFFGGLSVEETAHVLKVPKRTVEREWTFGRAWLRTELGASASM